MKGAIWQLEGEFGSFRPFYASSMIDTYPFPPKTSIIGMIGAGCGWTEEELVDYYDEIKVGIKIDHYDSIFNDLMKIWKVENTGQQKIFVVVKRFLFRPRFTIFLRASNDLIKTIESGLNDPVYPITLGDSDSLFYPRGNWFEILEEVPEIRTKKFRCLVDATLAGGMKYEKPPENIRFKIHPKIVKMPVKFKQNRDLDTPRDVLLHSGGVVKLKNDIGAYEFKGESVYLF